MNESMMDHGKGLFLGNLIASHGRSTVSYDRNFGRIVTRRKSGTSSNSLFGYGLYGELGCSVCVAVVPAQRGSERFTCCRPSTLFVFDIQVEHVHIRTPL